MLQLKDEKFYKNNVVTKIFELICYKIIHFSNYYNKIILNFT